MDPWRNRFVVELNGDAFLKKFEEIYREMFSSSSWLKPRGVPRSNESDGASLTGLGSVALDSRRLHCRLLKRSQDQRDLKQVLASIRTRGSIGLRSQDNLRPRCIAHLSGFGGRY